MRTLSALALLGILGTAGSAQAADWCKNVDISVTNHHPSGDPIKVLYVAYETDDDWFEGYNWIYFIEQLDNKVPNHDVTVTWKNQDLNWLYEGEATYWRVYFQRQLTGGLFPTYDDVHYQLFDRTGNPCERDGSYSFTVDAWGSVEE